MNKKINQLGVRTAVSTDLALVGDPTTGTSYKTTFGQLPLVPYTGATGAVSLGLYGLTAGTLTLQEQPLNGSTYKLTQRMASNDYWSIYGFASVADYGDLYFELQDNAAFADGQRFRFHYGNASSGTPKDILVMDYNSATIDGTVKVNTLAGTSIRMVVSDSQGQLSTQAIPSLSSGGSSVAYYLNGGTAASVGTYYQMSTTAVLGAAADFNLVGNGLISQFLTDVGDPNRLEIPGGNWNFEMYFNISSSGGNSAFYLELLKYNGTTFTSIASNVGTPEEITGGTSIDLYLTSLAIPQTTLLVTDRLALRVYIVNNSGGRTVTLHTQDSHLCEIITNFAGGVAALNGLTANTQYFATGTSGTDFGISSISDTHTFNLPTASATNRGALSSADWSTFNNKQASLTLTTTGTSGAATLVGATLNIPQYSGGGGSMAIGGAITSATAGSVLFAGTSGVLQQDNANFFWDDTNNRLGIGTATPTLPLDVVGEAKVNGLIIGKGFNTLANIRLTTSSNSLINVTTGTGNVVVGDGGQAITSGTNNFMLGALSAFRISTGSNNISIGSESLLNTTTQSNNIALGNRAGAYQTGFNNLTPTSCIYIGNNCFSGAVSPTNEIVIGNGTNTIGLGSNTTIIGNSSTITTALRGRLILGTLSDSGLYTIDVNGTTRIVSKLSLGAGTTSNAQINLASSTAPTSPNNGDIWFDGTDLKMRIGGVTKTFTLI